MPGKALHAVLRLIMIAPPPIHNNIISRKHHRPLLDLLITFSHLTLPLSSFLLRKLSKAVDRAFRSLSPSSNLSDPFLSVHTIVPIFQI